jgi:hypothetical protein
MNEKFTRKLYDFAKSNNYKKDYNTFLEKLQSDPAFQEKIYNGITNMPKGYQKDFITFVEAIGATKSDPAKLDAAMGVVAPNDPAVQEQLDYFKDGYLSTMRASSGLGDKFDEMLTKFQDPTLQVNQDSWNKLNDKQKAFVTLANRINKSDNFKDLNTALDFAEGIMPGYRNKLEMSLRKKEFNPENSVVKALLPNQQYRKEQGEGTGSQIVGGLWDVLGLPTRTITAGVSGTTPQAEELGFLQRMGRPDPLSTEAERFADFTIGGTLPGTGIAGVSGSIARKVPALNKLVYGGETFKDLVEAKSLADIAKQTRLGNAGRGAIRGAGRGVADAIVPAAVIASNPDENDRNWKTEAALTMLGGGIGGALLGGAGGGIVSPKTPDLLEAATRDRLAKSIGVPKQTTSDYGANQINTINKLLAGKQKEVMGEKELGLDQLAEGLYGRAREAINTPTDLDDVIVDPISNYVQSQALNDLSNLATDAAPWEKEAYEEVLGWLGSMPTTSKPTAPTLADHPILNLVNNNEPLDLDGLRKSAADFHRKRYVSDRIIDNPITYLDDISNRLAKLGKSSDDPVKAEVYSKAAGRLGETKDNLLDDILYKMENNIPYEGSRNRIDYQGQRRMGGMFDDDGWELSEMQSTLADVAAGVKGSGESLRELAALQKRVPSADDKTLTQIGEARLNPVKQGNIYARELQAKNDVLNYIQSNFSESEIKQALEDAGITSLDYVADAVAREISTGSKAGKKFDPSDLLNLIPTFALAKGTVKLGLGGVGGAVKGSAKQVVGTGARGLSAPETEEAPSLHMLVKGGSAQVPTEPVTKQWANVDEMWLDWQNNQKRKK